MARMPKINTAGWPKAHPTVQILFFSEDNPLWWSEQR